MKVGDKWYYEEKIYYNNNNYYYYHHSILFFKEEYYKMLSIEKVYINGVLIPRESQSIYIKSTNGEITEVLLQMDKL